MDGELKDLLLYVIIGLIGVIASIYQNKQKRRQAQSMPTVKRVPRDIAAEPEPDFGPDLGPLMELFDIPAKRPVQEYETVESGPGVEEEGMLVDSREAASELEGMHTAAEGTSLDTVQAESFEEGQSDIQKMIARYDAIRKELNQDFTSEDDIAAGEIVSVEAQEAANLRNIGERMFDLRKAIIYSEILKRKEF
jgi:hypothetical protein